MSIDIKLEKLIPQYIGDFVNDDDTCELFYGDQTALEIKRDADSRFLCCYGPLPYKDVLDYKSNDGFRSYRKKYQAKILAGSLIYHRIVAGPFTPDDAEKYIKNLKENDEF